MGKEREREGKTKCVGPHRTSRRRTSERLVDRRVRETERKRSIFRGNTVLPPEFRLIALRAGLLAGFEKKGEKKWFANSDRERYIIGTSVQKKRYARDETRA